MTCQVGEMDRFFNPKSIAVMGASGSSARTGYALVSNLQKIGFNGSIYLVDPGITEVLGIRACPSINRIPGQADLAVIALKAPMVPQAMQECGEAGVKAAVVVSDGFAEGGGEGKRLQQSVIQVGKDYGIRVMGPNSQGLINLDQDVFVFGGSAVFPESIKRDGVSFVAQTSLFLEGWLIRSMSPEGVGLDKSVDLGNMCDVDHDEVLAYLGCDPATRVIVIHMDRIDKPAEFIEIAKRVVALKPMVVVKLGKSPAARKAVFSHTGSLVGDDTAFENMCEQIGLAAAADFDEVEDLVKTFLYLPPLTGKRIAIVDSTGAAAPVAADACVHFGLEVTELSPVTVDRLRAVLPSEASVTNPINLVGIHEANNGRKRLLTAVDALLADPNIDGVVLAAAITSKHMRDEYVGALNEVAGRHLKKPIGLWVLSDIGTTRSICAMAKKGLVPYPSVTRVVKALAASYARHHYLNSGEPSIVSQS